MRSKIILKSGGVIWETIKFAAIALLIIVPFRLWIAQPFIVKGASMEPNFSSGEYLIIDEFSYNFLREPKRGEVIVFRYPLNPSEFFIKRVIGLPGETIEIKSEGIKIYNQANPNGFKLDESYLPDISSFLEEKVSLAQGDYFVLGDNRNASLDSRRWGALNESLIVGRAVLRLWPLQRLSFLPGIYQTAYPF